MSKLDPKNREEAFFYQLEDMVKPLKAFATLEDSNAFKQQLYIIEDMMNVYHTMSTEDLNTILPITYGMIKATCGWSEFAELTNKNPYMVKEYGIGDNEIFKVKKEHAKKLGIIK